MRPDDAVVGVVVDGRPRAYPWWIIRHYHVINDTITIDHPGALSEAWTAHVHHPRETHKSVQPYVPLLITLCEACSGASVFVPVVAGRIEGPLVFSQCRGDGPGPGAFSAIGTYTICDLQTQSRWHPFSGRAASGPLAGARLERKPVFLERWNEWRAQHPDTVVLIGGTELRLRPHGSGSDIGTPGEHPTYRREVERTGVEDRRLARHTMVLGVGDRERTDAVAVPLETLRAAGGLARLEVASEPLVFERVGGEPFRMRDASGSLWNDRGEAFSGPNAGRSLEPAADSYLVEWSDWIMEHPRTRVVTDPAKPEGIAPPAAGEG
jgi:hypothetical protein